MAARRISRNCSQLTASTPSSAARAFLQITSRRYLSSTPPPVLDFLLPRVPGPLIRYIWTGENVLSRSQIRARRAFSSSGRQQQTTAIYNPRRDDDGNPMQIEITPRASNRLREIMSKDANPHLALRIQVESGGCHGFQYLMSLTTLPPLSDIDAPAEEATPALNTSSNEPNAMPSRTSPPCSPSLPSESKKEEKVGKLDEDDTVFATEGGAGAKVVMDGPSLDLLKGSKIDYTMELIGSQFKIMDNPLATSSCGCGTSFDIKS